MGGSRDGGFRRGRGCRERESVRPMALLDGIDRVVDRGVDHRERSCLDDVVLAIKASVFNVWTFQALTSSAARAAVVTASPTSVKPAVMRFRLRVIVFGMVPSLASPSTWLAALATQVKLGSSVNHRR